MRVSFREHFFYILILLIIIVCTASFFRFIVNHDYMVTYERVCDPEKAECFIGCEDDACTTEYYYLKVVKYAPDLLRECGEDIKDCELASHCLPDDKKCSITYCDKNVNGNSCKTSSINTGYAQ